MPTGLRNPPFSISLFYKHVRNDFWLDASAWWSRCALEMWNPRCAATKRLSFGAGRLRGRGNGWRCRLRLTGADALDDFGGSGFADGARGVVDAAFGQGQIAAAGAGLGVEAMQSVFF